MITKMTGVLTRVLDDEARLQVGPFESKSTAQSACNALGVACFPVPAK